MWSSDAIWRHKYEKTLAQVMACCLTAPSPYPNKRRFIIKGVLWHSHGSHSSRSAHELNLYHVFGNYPFKRTNASLRGRWVNVWRVTNSGYLYVIWVMFGAPWLHMYIYIYILFRLSAILCMLFDITSENHPGYFLFISGYIVILWSKLQEIMWPLHMSKQTHTAYCVHVVTL